MSDSFANQTPGLTSPASQLAAITPDDNNDLPTTARGIYVGVGGDINVIAANDSAAVLMQSVPSGSVLPVRAKRVKSTLTTASGLVALI